MKNRLLAPVRFTKIDHFITLNHVPILGSTTMPSFEASLDITLEGMASKSFYFPLNHAMKLCKIGAHASFGFYLQATIVPPAGKGSSKISRCNLVTVP